MSINETVLEMHFHSSLIDSFRDTYGLGTGSFNFYKYSTRKECFIGFDQAFVKTDLSDDELFSRFKSNAIKNGYNFSNFFIGYFLQFKVVKIFVKSSRHTPKQISSRPYYRVSLDTKKNANTGFSQHELLYNLNINQGAMVYYACPMLFDRLELYNKNPNLDLLRLADLNDCPSIYTDNDSHFIFFNDIVSQPIWCSEPVEGRAITPTQLIENMYKNIHHEEFYKNQLELLDFLINIKDKKLSDVIKNSITFLEFYENI